MKEQLIQYVNLLFAGAPDSEEIKQEILQNTLDRYDDLIDQGKLPEAAYRLAITGIGDISEILSGNSAVSAPAANPTQSPAGRFANPERRKRIAVAVAMYILCPFPLIILSEIGAPASMGLLLMFALIAAATGLLILNSREASDKEAPKETSPSHELHKSLDMLIWAVGLLTYFLLSFATHAWYITWLVFPLTGAVRGLIRAIRDLKEVQEHEN